MNSATSPRVTVLMAVHNGAAYLDEALQSILAQTFTDFEFLIVDDGSTDRTAEKIAAYVDSRIRMVANEENIGLTRSLNRGLSLARGALVARQDADDVSHPERLARQVEFLERNPDVVVVGTQVRIVDVRGRTVDNGLWPKSTSNRAIRWQLIFDSPFVHASVMFRRDIIWSGLGGYNEDFRTSQDFELWCRTAAAGYPMRNLPDTLLKFRVHEASSSSRYELTNVAKVRAVFLDSLTAQLGAGGVPPGWPDSWIRVTNPRLYPDGPDRAAAVSHALRSIHARFVEKCPDAAGDVEIQRHLAAMLMRVAQLGAGRGDLSSLSVLRQACRLDARVAARAVPRYVGRLLIR